MKLIYSLGVVLYTALIYIASPFSQKARKWTRGRRKWAARLEEYSKSDRPTIWFHCASLGEFEQGRPLIEKLKERAPETRILLTFFSPSGFEIRKRYEKADLVLYLPPDTPGNARRFLRLARPERAIFIKYEFWYNYLEQLQKSEIPVYLVSGIFRKEQPFFRSYGRFFRKHLAGFRHFYIQDENSASLLKEIGIDQYTVCGDTRFDRVHEISLKAADIEIIERFKCDEKLVVAGSSWPPDEGIIAGYINTNPDNLKWAIAPHEIDAASISRLESLINVPVIRYSEADKGDLTGSRVLIIDNIGLLSSVYRYASIAVIGGGFGKGIHNILEAATWGIPVMFGPNYKRFREAVNLIGHGGAWSFTTDYDFSTILDRFINEDNFLEKSGRSSLLFIRENLGASDIICSDLLTNRT